MNRIMGRQTTHNTKINQGVSYRNVYDYYMPGANAVAPEYLREDEKQQEIHHNIAVKPKRKTEVAQWLATLAAVFAMGLILVGQYVYIGSLGYEVSQAKSELKTVQVQNEKIKNQISAAGGLQNVELVAVNYMGMHKPSSQEIIYLSATE